MRKFWRVGWIALLAISLAMPAMAAKGFLKSDDAKEDGEPTT